MAGSALTESMEYIVKRIIHQRGVYGFELKGNDPVRRMDNKCTKAELNIN